MYPPFSPLNVGRGGGEENSQPDPVLLVFFPFRSPVLFNNKGEGVKICGRTSVKWLPGSRSRKSSVIRLLPWVRWGENFVTLVMQSFWCNSETAARFFFGKRLNKKRVSTDFALGRDWGIPRRKRLLVESSECFGGKVID